MVNIHENNFFRYFGPLFLKILPFQAMNNTSNTTKKILFSIIQKVIIIFQRNYIGSSSTTPKKEMWNI